MPDILFLTQVLPYPLDAGPKVRAYHMLRHLASQHRVTLVSFVRPDDRPEHIEHLRGIAAAVHTVPIRRSLPRNLWAAMRGLLTGLPIVIARDEMPAMAATLRRLTRETRFDVIHADQLSMAGWGLLAADLRGFGKPRRSIGPRPRLLLDEHNAIYRLTERMADAAHGPRRWLMRREARAFRCYEAAMLRAYDAVLTVTEEDRALLMALQESGDSDLQSKFTVIPICVDPETSRQVVSRQGNKDSPLSPCLPVSLSPCLPVSLSTPTILHLGTMFWPPNAAGVLWFAREVLPLVWREVPDAAFVIVGKNPPAEVRALATSPQPLTPSPQAEGVHRKMVASILSGARRSVPGVVEGCVLGAKGAPHPHLHLRRSAAQVQVATTWQKQPCPSAQDAPPGRAITDFECPQVIVTGYVPDPQPYLAAADAFVVPLHAGGGMRVKILDAWLWGLPVVSTPLGAEGIALRDGENILLAADAPAFAAAVVRLLRDPDLNARLRRNGRAWVEQTYSWQAVYRQVDAVYAGLLGA